jgi:hypothetical protein
MTSYVFYPVTGDGQTKATEFVWNAGQMNWNTSSDWVQGDTLVFQNPALAPGAVPGSNGGSGAGASQGAADNVGLVAGEVASIALQAYQPNPSKGDPFIGSNVLSVDVLINSGTVGINNLLLSGFNQYADAPQLPTLDVEGATFKVGGSISDSQAVLFPTISTFIGPIGGLLQATGGGTIDIGDGGTVQVSGSVQSQITLHFNDASNDQLTLSGVSASAPAAFAGTVDNFVAGDTIFLPGLTSPGSDTTAFNNGTLSIIDGTTTVAALAMTGGVTSGFALSNADGGTDLTIGAAVTASATASLVANAYLGIERVAIPGGVTGSTATSVAAAITGGTQTLAGYEASLVALDQTLYTTLPALVTIDAYYNATPQPATLNAVAAATGAPSQTGGFYSGQYLHSLGYSDSNVWTIMASQWGADPTSAFFKLYDPEFVSGGVNYSDFISAVYQREFGFTPSAANLQTLVNDVPGVQALLSGGGAAPSPIQVVSGIYGYLLYVGQTTPSLPTQYATSANAFLTAAANGTVSYGPELTQQFPPGTTSGVVASAEKAAVDPSVITVSSSDQLVDPGTGSFTIQFLPGTSKDTLVLHTGGTDQVSGFDPASDVLDLSALAAGTGLGLTGNLSALSNYVSVADQGGNAVVQFSSAGTGGGGTVAVLQGLGGTSLATLIAQGAIRMT